MSSPSLIPPANPAFAPLGAVPKLTPRDLKRLSEIVASQLGIQLNSEKETLVIARLQGRVRELGFDSFREYCDYLSTERTGEGLADLANRISTNHTAFFRETPHFELLSKQLLPELTQTLKRAGTNDLRVWTAACSTGEEAYTLALVLLDHLGAERPSWKAGLLATDISDRALSIARAGVYPIDRTLDVPKVLRTKYFTRVDQKRVSVTPELKSEVTFRRLNLIKGAFPFRQPFHLIFCRNVMIYFDQPTRERLISKLCELLAPGGYLFVGHAEGIGRVRDDLSFVQAAVYRKVSR